MGVQARIDEIERECRSIERSTGAMFGPELWEARAHYKTLRRRLGWLLRMRDKAERPHIYQ